ncbi:MAG: hypothetical protein JOZ05_10865 [Acetobacteraceae bacterium]|nr:hypothetical protein [Acetobacteraceae bacterium]
MDTSLTNLLTYAFCCLLVLLYASARFNTPPGNSSTTVRLWYWQGLGAYIISCLTLFAVLSIILEQPKLRDFLLWQDGASPSKEMQRALLIPPALAATLVMTTLLPSVPYIKRVDDALLSFFLRMASIPGEVTRRAHVLRLPNFRVTEADLQEVMAFINEEPIPDEAVQHLRASAVSRWEESELRYTKLILLLSRVDKLQERSGYSRFFSKNKEEYRQLRDEIVGFVAKSVRGLAQAARLRAQESREEYEELIRDRREAFVAACAQRFEALGLLLARAVLHTELAERDVQSVLRRIGFQTVTVDRVVLPIHHLATVCFLILVYLLLAGSLMALPAGDPHEAEFKSIPFLIAVAHIVTIGFTLWFMQRFAWARREPGETRPVASYLLCATLCAGMTIAICVLFDLARLGALPSGARLLFFMPFGLLCGLLCAMTAFCCDDAPPSVPEPWWFPCLEGVGCALATVGVSWMLLRVFPPPEGMPQPPSKLIPLLLPAGTAFVIGVIIPRIYRAGRRLNVAAVLPAE